MYKLKYISLFTFLIFSGGLYAQSDSVKQEGEIVMTKEELKSFLKFVAETKLKKMEENKEIQNKLGLAEAKVYYYNQLRQRQSGNYYEESSQQQSSQQELLFEIEKLNSKVNHLLSSSKSGGSNTIVIPSGTSTNKVLKETTSSNVQDTQMKKDFETLNQKFEELNSRLQNASKEERKSALEELLSKYGNFKKQVFFANNSSQVSDSDVKYINDVIQVLKKNPELSIVLEGYASPVGRADYNKQLSMKRAESVKSVLETKGVVSSRIVAAFKGEDHSGSESHARRVDMSIIVK